MEGGGETLRLLLYPQLAGSLQRTREQLKVVVNKVEELVTVPSRQRSATPGTLTSSATSGVPRRNSYEFRYEKCLVIPRVQTTDDKSIRVIRGFSRNFLTNHCFFADSKDESSSSAVQAVFR